jgi:hypothetical protein
MRFICLGYADETKWETMPKHEQEALMGACFNYDKELRQSGRSPGGGEALQSVRTAKTLRWQNGKLAVTDGPFAETKEQLGGFCVIEADDISHAVELISKHPGLRFGPMEIRPADIEASAQCTSTLPLEAEGRESSRRFLCLGYMDEKTWDVLSKGEQESLMQEFLAYDEGLRKSGHWLGAEGLQSVRSAKTLRWTGGKVSVTDGPYAETKEQLGGVVVLSAKDINQAVELVSRHPAIRFGVKLEIRPADEEMSAACAAAGTTVALKN